MISSPLFFALLISADRLRHVTLQMDENLKEKKADGGIWTRECHTSLKLKGDPRDGSHAGLSQERCFDTCKEKFDNGSEYEGECVWGPEGVDAPLCRYFPGTLGPNRTTGEMWCTTFRSANRSMYTTNVDDNQEYERERQLWQQHKQARMARRGRH